MSLAQHAPRPDSRLDLSSPAEDDPVDGTGDRRLADVLAPCFALIVHLRSHNDYGDPAALRHRVRDLLQRAEQDARGGGTSRDHVEAGLFAVVAFLDETILSSTWPEKDAWASRPLQMERYDRFDAGEVFFNRLSDLLDHPGEHAEAIEVYYLCLTLGFRGRYQILQQEKLQEFIDRCHDGLHRAPGLQPDVLAPNARPSDQAATEVQSAVSGWMLALAGIAVAVLLYLGFSLTLAHSATESAQTIEQMIVRPPTE